MATSKCVEKVNSTSGPYRIRKKGCQTTLEVQREPVPGSQINQRRRYFPSFKLNLNITYKQSDLNTLPKLIRSRRRLDNLIPCKVHLFRNADEGPTIKHHRIPLLWNWNSLLFYTLLVYKVKFRKQTIPLIFKKLLLRLIWVSFFSRYLSLCSSIYLICLI